MQIAPAPDLAGLLQGMAGFGDAPAVRWFAAAGEQALSYRDFAQRMEAAAARLQGHDVGPGARVLLLAESGLPWAIGALGVLRAGGVLVPLDAHSPDDTLQHVLADAAPVLVLTDAEHAPRCAGCGAPVVLVDALAESGPVPAAVAVAGLDPASPAVMFYTSGTTGPPKGVPLSHANLLYQLRSVAAADLARPGDRVLLPLPMHHVYPFVIGLLLPIVAGVTLLLPGATTGAQIMQ
ncbi:MAG TPA: AMP-binding protein, partial [Immundisolibacter sp.]